MNRKIKILVVDDSAFMRRVISDIINSDYRFTVIGTAKNGEEGLEKVRELDPDVITLDVDMPEMDGLEMLKILMKENPKPVLLISAYTKEGADTTIRALGLGAADFITKPSNIFKMNEKEIRDDIIKRILLISNISNFPSDNKKRTSKSSQDISPKDKKEQKQEQSVNSNIKKIVAIGTSTGGPRALQEVLPDLPQSLPATYVIVQHMPSGFTKSLAERLNNICQIRVKEAEDKDVLHPGVAYIAPGNYHILIEKMPYSNDLWIRLSSSPSVSGHRPSVNVMLNSLSEINSNDIIGVIMTGMGNDGCEGMKKLKSNNNAYVIAQDEKTSVIYGMPKAVIDEGIADAIVPINKIAKEIIRVVEVH
ncbi:MAG: chemotaxis response regulator protein-glutamate methylesterase [Epulopiscium sp.]|nr:chemotaxis response regulator protein-glutamate methylesterase [Candidatus Epulonipiscium sp.]